MKLSFHRCSALILKYIILISAVTATCTSCAKNNGNEKKEQAETVVGIAWREDSDKEGFTDVVCSFKSIGIKAVLLPQGVDYDIPYNGNKVSSECLDADGILKQEWADLVKKNTYVNSNVASAVNNVVAIVFTGGEDITPTLYRVPQAWHGPEKDKDFNATRDISDYLLMSYCIAKHVIKSPNESNYMNYTQAQSIFRNFVNISCEIIQGRVERPY